MATTSRRFCCSVSASAASQSQTSSAVAPPSHRPRLVRSVSSSAFSQSQTSSAVAPQPPRPRLVYSIFEAHDHHFNDHVERPGRIQGISRALAAAAFLGPQADPALAAKIKELAPTRHATLDEIALVHSYGQDLQAKAAAATPHHPLAVADLGDPDGVTYVTSASWDCATTALGATLDLIDAVVDASKQPLTPTSSPSDPTGTPTGFAIIRPPGHHATPETPLGYCLLNNAAVAARYAQRRHGLHKILLLDIDVHNGNGSCEAFWEDPSVFVVDVHEASAVYPTPEFVPSGVDDVGAGQGEGFTMNVPLPRSAGHDSMMAVMSDIITPTVRRFNPDMILVSAGYDAHVTDPFQLLQMRSCTYYAVVQKLRELADEVCCGRLLFMLEGGYDAGALGESVVETWRACVGAPSNDVNAKKALPQPEPMEEVRALLQRVKYAHTLL